MGRGEFARMFGTSQRDWALCGNTVRVRLQEPINLCFKIVQVMFRPTELGATPIQCHIAGRL